jgi:hypothetical protein
VLNVINQFRRMITDDGRNDKSFVHDEARLKGALTNLKLATDALIRASQTLQDLLMDKEAPPTQH